MVGVWPASHAASTVWARVEVHLPGKAEFQSNEVGAAPVGIRQTEVDVLKGDLQPVEGIGGRVAVAIHANLARQKQPALGPLHLDLVRVTGQVGAASTRSTACAIAARRVGSRRHPDRLRRAKTGPRCPGDCRMPERRVLSTLIGPRRHQGGKRMRPRAN